jgi:hypothetical protein
MRMPRYTSSARLSPGLRYRALHQRYMHSRGERVVWVYVRYRTSIGVDNKFEIGKKAHKLLTLQYAESGNDVLNHVVGASGAVDARDADMFTIKARRL